MKQARELYAVRLHDRDTENDPILATLMRSYELEGPWHDVATGHPDSIWELFELTYLRDELNRLREVCDKHGIGWEYAGDDIEDDSDG
jgi:hypothetical protein